MKDVAVQIVPRTSQDGHPFSELLHTWTEDDKPRCALSRIWYLIDDTPHARANAIEQFKKRRARVA